MNMRIIYGITLISVLVSLNGMLYAQRTLSATEDLSVFNRAEELFEKEKYSAALTLFDKYVDNSVGDVSGKLTKAEYLAAICAVRLYNSDSEYRINNFVRNHPESPLNNQAWLELANSFYQGKNYRKALSYYGLTDRLELSEELLPEYYFKFGYSHFMKGDRQRAMLYFSEIMDVDTEYTPPAIYYFSHIAYENGKYRTALDGFKRLKEDESFGSVVPFYIIQIMYVIGDNDGIIEMGPELVTEASPDRASELYRIIGDAYFKKENYSEAVKNLEEHTRLATRTGREGNYQLAYCYYMTGEHDRAIPLFQEVCRRRDELSQNAFYLLGDIYLDRGEKKMAQAAFSSASQMDFDEKIKEESLFNFAKLTYETSYAPFGEVIRAFQEYIEQYPGSDNISEAYDILVAAYMKIKNYKAAISSLDRIAVKGERLERAYQKVAFYRGLELFKNLNLQSAVAMFEKSLNYGRYDRDIRARTLYWMGESWYRMNDIDNALNYYEEFMGIPGSSLLEEYKMVHYNIAYVHYNKQDYPEALSWFRKFESEMVGGSTRLIADLYNRIADCYYIATRYDQAISYYDRVINAKAPGADYAMFQKGFAQGLMHDQRAKELTLSSLITSYGESVLVPNALFERGRAYVSLSENTRGENDFKSIINSFPNSVFVPRAMVQLGLMYFNQGENQKAISQYKEVIEKYGSTPEGRSALTGLRTTYVEINDVDSYFSYVKTLGSYADISTSERDSLLYISGENLYIQGNCDRASSVFRSYLEEFESGSFRINASFYLADCLASTGNTDEALQYYLGVTASPNNPFLEQTFGALARIYYTKEEYRESFRYFSEMEKVAEIPENILDAKVGQLRSAYQMGDAVKAISASARVLESGILPEELAREATFISAKSNYALDNMDKALEGFRKLASEVITSEGAESKYRLAEILFSKGNADAAEALVYEFIDQNTPHQYWMARMFILLSDISISKDDEFQARATLQSLADYYQIQDDGILDEVKAKLNELDLNNPEVKDTIKLSIKKNSQ